MKYTKKDSKPDEVLDTFTVTVKPDGQATDLDSLNTEQCDIVLDYAEMNYPLIHPETTESIIVNHIGLGAPITQTFTGKQYDWLNLALLSGDVQTMLNAGLANNFTVAIDAANQVTLNNTTAGPGINWSIDFTNARELAYMLGVDQSNLIVTNAPATAVVTPHPAQPIPYNVVHVSIPEFEDDNQISHGPRNGSGTDKISNKSFISFPVDTWTRRRPLKSLPIQKRIVKPSLSSYCVISPKLMYYNRNTGGYAEPKRGTARNLSVNHELTLFLHTK